MDTLKRLVDLVGVLCGLVVFSPVMLAIAVCIRLTSAGPIFYRQPRLGRGGRPFAILKFRSMYVNAADIRNADGSAYSSANDPRVTPIGRLLRSTSLDELPQLINVLKGDMSLVGPRPDQPDQMRFYSPEDRIKLSVKPGLTGLAQISGRNSIPWELRRTLDVQYVRTRSIALDLSILFRTVPYVLRRSDIYVDGIK